MSDNINILFYYSGLHNSDHPWAGTSVSIIKLAQKLSELYPNIISVLTGDFVKEIEIYDNCLILPFPETIDGLSVFINRYDIVFIATDIHKNFSKITKPKNQVWLLHQHCWDLTSITREYFKVIDAVLALSEKHKASLIKNGVNPKIIRVVQNSIDVNNFYPDISTRLKHSIMFSGAIVKHKGVHILLDAFVKVREKYPNSELHLYGSSKMWREDGVYEEQLKQKNLSGVVFHGEIENAQMPQMYRKHDIICLPSEIESCGLVIIEAQACGCIPVVHNSGGTSEILQDGITGFLYSPNNSYVLASTICQALSEIEKDPKIRERSVNFAHENFSLDKEAARLGKALQVLCEQDQQPLDVAKNTELFNTPVLFLIFNRPDITQRVFNEIKKIKPKQLFVAADGPRNKDEIEKCNITRKIIEQVDWDCNLKLLFRDKNLGCKEAVSSAITWFFGLVDKGIVLEDDCLPNLSFFQYCEELLNKYNDNPRIGLISGDNFQNGNVRSPYSYYYSKYIHVWGWASWKRVWNLYDPMLKDWSIIKNTNWHNELFDEQELKYWTDTLNSVYEGKINTWDYQFNYLLWKYNMLSILPSVNSISNIGFGSESTHTNKINNRMSNIKRQQMIFPLNHPLVIKRNVEADIYTKSHGIV